MGAVAARCLALQVLSLIDGGVSLNHKGTMLLTGLEGVHFLISLRRLNPSWTWCRG